MRTELGKFLVATALLAAPSVAGAETILQNDSVGEAFDATSASARLIEGEMYEAVFDIPEDWAGVEMLGVRVVMVQSNLNEDAGCPPPCTNACGRFGIDVWEEGSSSPISDNCIIDTINYKNPGNLLFTQDSVIDPQTSTVLGFEVRGDATRGQATFKDLRFSTINQIQGVTISPVRLPAGKVRVAIRALDLQCTAGGQITEGDHFPVLLSDNGISAPLRNFVYGQPLLPDPLNPGSTIPICTSGMPQHYVWEDFAPLFSTAPVGDFVMRLILNRDDANNPDPDMGMGGDDMGTTEPDMGTTEPDMGISDMGASDMGSGENNGNNDNNATGLAITSVTPNEGDNGSSTDIVILGSGFAAGAEVLLDARNIGVTETQSGRIRATVPEGLAPGAYDVIVTNPDGASAILMDGFTVTSAGPDGGGSAGTSDGCCAQVPASGRTPGAALLALLGLLGIWTRRRRV